MRSIEHKLLHLIPTTLFFSNQIEIDLKNEFDIFIFICRIFYEVQYLLWNILNAFFVEYQKLKY